MRDDDSTEDRRRAFVTKALELARLQNAGQPPAALERAALGLVMQTNRGADNPALVLAEIRRQLAEATPPR